MAESSDVNRGLEIEAINRRVDDLASQISDMMALLKESMLQRSTLPISDGGVQVVNLTDEEEKQKVTEKGKAKVQIDPEGYPEMEEVEEAEKAPGSQTGQVTEAKKLEKMVRSMQEELRALKGEKSYSHMNLTQFGVTVDMVLPRDFKMPEMEKFNGTTDPVQHLKLYCTKMTIWSRDTTFLMGLFHESLSGAAFQWFMDLEPEQKQDWDSFCHLFVEEYDFNQEVEPTREDLGRMRKKEGENFRQYAQRWRGTAKKVKPPLSPKELNDYFLGTLEECYVSKMVGSTYPTFSSLVEVGERIETLIMRGKVSKEVGENSAPTDHRKGFGPRRDVNMVQSHSQPPFQPISPPLLPYHYPTQPTLGYYPPPINTTTPFLPPLPNPHPPNPNLPFANAQNPRGRPPRNNRRPQDNRPFPNFNVSKQELLDHLLQSQVITLLPEREWKPPYPFWYKPEECCIFHSGAAGHSIDTCPAFKAAVLDLLDRKVIVMDSLPTPNVQTNPLPYLATGGASVNVVDVVEGPLV